MRLTRERHLAKVLNGLIETCCDSSDGYELAAQGVVDLRLKQLLRSLSMERRSFVEELRQEVERLGGEPRVCGTVRGALQRGWLRMTGSQPSSTLAILRQCAYAEGLCLERYERAIAQELPEDLNALAARHYLRLTEVRDLLADLEDIHS